MPEVIVDGVLSISMIEVIERMVLPRSSCNDASPFCTCQFRWNLG